MATTKATGTAKAKTTKSKSSATTRAKAKSNRPKRDLYAEVTANIVKALRTGKAPWADTGGAQPFNAISREPYHGVNVLALWHKQCGEGYPTTAWMTYKQAADVGGQVREGEHGVLCVKYNIVEKVEVVDGLEKLQRIPFLIAFTLFNLAQIDNLPEKYTGPRCSEQGAGELESMLLAQGATVVPSLDVAGYDAAGDFIAMPAPETYPSLTARLATEAHAYVAWTGPESRCNRRVSDALAALAYDELVAELGAAFLCAEHGIRDSVHHAEYVEGWIQLLEKDNRVLFTAAKQARAAVSWLHENASTRLSPAEPEALAA